MSKRKSKSKTQDPTRGEPPRSGDAPPQAPSVAAAPYVVLARKYRPQTFADLIGQDAMVRTLRNAFATGRIAQAYMLTGVRGVGKTTTARIIARALNYSRPGRADGPTFDLEETGEHCQAIMESRHPDVLEMDAASNTGVENVREIIESARYHPVSARMKVYIIDEVHMLSKGAFNALLKTLEEPPAHVKFIFATTEVRKVPVTVLSRCQRFDLRRVDAGVLMAHFEAIAGKEGVSVEPDALGLVARAAEGSVRDGLSILDQAFATGSGKVTAELVRSMLGLADRARVLDLLEATLSGDARGALAWLAGLHADGADPVQLLGEMAEAVHAVTRARVAGAAAAGDTLSAEEKARTAALAQRLDLALLSRAWQMLVKGLEDAARAPDTLAAAEMVVIRMAHAAGLPSPEDVLRRLAAGETLTDEAATGPGGERRDVAPRPTEARGREPPAAAAPERNSPGAPRAPAGDAGREPRLGSFAELVDFVGAKRDALLKIELEERVSLVRFEPPHLELSLLEGADPGLATSLAQKLSRWTGERWMVALSREPGERPLGEVRREREAREIEAVRRHPKVEELLRRFPDAEITGVRPIGGEDSVAGGEG